MAPLEIRLLGKLQLLRDGRNVALPRSKKTRALLAYLTAIPGAHSRQQLCDLLWDGPDDPRAALRWSLSRLRPIVDDGRDTRLATNQDGASFDRRATTIDLVALKADVAGGVGAASIEALARAAGQFRGEFLEELDLPDSYRYHEWWTAERESLRALRVAILATLVERLRHTPETALAHARARLLADPFSEAAHISIIELLGALGRTREALQQYESCRRMLEGQLGARPSPSLERARAALGVGHTSSLPPPVVVVQASSAPMPPLVGRATELKQIAMMVAAASSGQGGDILWMTGEPGIGKTRLLEEVAANVHAAHGTVLMGRAYEAEMVRPYAAWIDALRSSALDVSDSALRSALTPLLPELSADPGGDRNRLFHGVVTLLEGLMNTGRPVALILDDVQWFDEGAAALLHFAGRSLANTRALIACGARTAELLDNAAVARVIRALRRDGRLRHLPLERLDLSGIRELVGRIDATLDSERVFAESEGNPLFAITIARALASGGGGSIPETLDGLITDRLDQIDESARALLPWAAAIGRSFTPELLRRVSGLSPAELIAAIEELEHREIVRVSQSAIGAYDFSHDLIRQVAYSRLSNPRRRVVHLQLARALSAVSDPESALAGDIAHHAALGGDAELAARATVAAGERSLRMFAYADAYALTERAMRHLDTLPRTRRIELHMALLKIAVHAGVAVPGARSLNSELSRLTLEAQDAGLAPEVATGFYLLSFRHHVRGEYAAAHDDTLKAAEAGRTGDAATAARALGNTGRCLALIERSLPRAESLLREARVLASQAHVDLKDVPWGLGLIQAFRGEYDEAAAQLDAALFMAHAEQDHWAECLCLQRLALLEIERGDPRSARARVQQLAPVAAKMGEGSERPFADALEALADWMLGDAAAVDRMERAISTLRDIDAKALLARVLTIAATIDLQHGHQHRASLRAEEARRVAEAVGHRSGVVMAQVLLARAALDRGDSAEATRWLDLSACDLTNRDEVAAYVRRAVQEAHSHAHSHARSHGNFLE